MNKSLRDEIRAVLALGLVSVAFAPAVYAQEAMPQQPTVAAAEEENREAQPEAEFQEVVVTGSRIRRTEFDSPAPVSVITSERSQLAGLLSTEEILRNDTGGRRDSRLAGVCTR